jgi:hypothetical protein
MPRFVRVPLCNRGTSPTRPPPLKSGKEWGGWVKSGCATKKAAPCNTDAAFVFDTKSDMKGPPLSIQRRIMSSPSIYHTRQGRA